jgi:hypothetical protein
MHFYHLKIIQKQGEEYTHNAAAYIDSPHKLPSAKICKILKKIIRFQ